MCIDAVVATVEPSHAVLDDGDVDVLRWHEGAVELVRGREIRRPAKVALAILLALVRTSVEKHAVIPVTIGFAGEEYQFDIERLVPRMVVPRAREIAARVVPEVGDVNIH
jgi:hypothetical protein